MTLGDAGKTLDKLPALVKREGSAHILRFWTRTLLAETVFGLGVGDQLQW